MYEKENNRITKEVTAFQGHGWKNWNDNVPMITFASNDGYGNSVDHFLTIEEAVEVIDLLETLIAQAKEAEDHKPLETPLFDDTPF